MSHLIKDNKFFLSSVKLILVTIILFFFAKGLFNYKGNILIYVVFSLVFNYLLIG